MGYALAYGPCVVCNKIFAFNPVKVPSLLWKGKREPVCKQCIERVNPKRIANGLEPIIPHHEAYGPCEESEL